MAALFMLGYVNSCDTGVEDNISHAELPARSESIQN